MKYIKKGEEPESFKTWKVLARTTPNWSYSYLQNPEKRELHNALLREQGYICCYCGMRIARENSHIEHLKPQSATDPDLSVEYTNLLASCQREREPKKPVHCGVAKDDWYDENLMVSPLQQNCTDFFIYTDDGQILETDTSEKKAAAATTIDRLCLNIPKLIAMRKEVINNLLADIDIDELTDEDRQKLIQGFEQPDADGRYEEFYGAIAYILNQYFT
ncbi:MAG TPA: TIGR02646 family protein [Cyanobacteria bacterium UBA8553]|nr:TIGR02646 family protein [Cyanobacteria bacterium UBA8553]